MRRGPLLPIPFYLSLPDLQINISNCRLVITQLLPVLRWKIKTLAHQTFTALPFITGLAWREREGWGVKEEGDKAERGEKRAQIECEMQGHPISGGCQGGF